MNERKKTRVSLFIFLVVGIFFSISFSYVYSQDQEWKPPELQEMEARFLELADQVSTLAYYAPDKYYPDYKDLEKINQLVEMLDFNKREFALLIQQYNLLEDKLFPFILNLSRQNPELKTELYNTLKQYTGKEEKSILALQERINTVAIQAERLEKRIERLQIASRDKEIADESKGKSDLAKPTADISAELLQLDENRKNYTAKLEEEEKKLAELIKDQEEKSAKVEEKKKEAANLLKQAAASRDNIERLIKRTFSQVREIRLNGLEIPQLNTIKTFIYLANTTIDTLKAQIKNTDNEIRALKTQQKKEIINRLVKAVIVVAAALIMVFLFIGISRRISKKIIAAMEESEKIEVHRKQRYQTLSAVILSFVKVVVWILAVLWVLGELNIDYAPFLVAAGGISLAIGFGAQSLVKDMVSGFFMLMEEQYALGDVVEINGAAGVVEKISLRTIKFRSLDGTLHTIPNGSISQVSNKTHHWSRAIVNVGVSYDANPQHVLTVMNTVCREMAEDPEWKEKIIEEPTPQGILSFGDSAINFRVLAKTKPGEQWPVERELHIRIKNAFDRENIEIPYNFVNIIDRTIKCA